MITALNCLAQLPMLRSLCVWFTFASIALCAPSVLNRSDIPGLDTLTAGNCDNIYGELIPGDCRAAIDQLPKDDPSDMTWDPQTQSFVHPIFSRTIANPRFKLPFLEQAESCAVEVSILPEMRSDSSLWSIIRRSADLVVLNCIIRGGGIGGFQLTGTKNGIKIALYEWSFSIPSNSSKVLSGSLQSSAVSVISRTLKQT